MSAPRTPTGQGRTLFGRGIPLGVYGGVRVSAHWSVLVILALLTDILAAGVLPAAAPGRGTAAYVATAVSASVVFLAALLAHEFAHALVARHYRMQVEQITLWMLGGLTELRGDAPSPRADAAIAAAGPLVSLGLGGAFGGVAWAIGDSTLIGAAALWLAAVSILLGGFNLLPGAPLDGGRLLRAALWHHYGDRTRAADLSARVGRAMGTFFVVFGVLQFFAGMMDGLWIALIGWFIISGAASEQYAGLVERLRGKTVGDVMASPPTLAPSWFTLAAFLAHLNPHEAAQQAFPVVGFNGELEGVLMAAQLKRVPPGERDTTRVRDISRKWLLPLTVTATTPLSDILQQLRTHAGVAVVVEESRLIGTVTAADIERAAGAVSLGPQRDGGSV